MADTSVPIEQMLHELGFDGSLAPRARSAMEQAGLTRPGKERIDGAKRGRVAELLDGIFHVTCGAAACAASAGGREVVVAARREACRVCGGSPNRHAVEEAARVFASLGIRRVLVVGGSPAVRDELRALAPAAWELRCVDGTERHTGKEARALAKWADLVAIWGGTELDHRVSEHYAGGARTVRTVRRGIAALMEDAVRQVQSRRG